jgi:hypothetical protein
MMISRRPSHATCDVGALVFLLLLTAGFPFFRPSADPASIRLGRRPSPSDFRLFGYDS